MMAKNRSNRIWVLGANDPEMEFIEDLLEHARERVAYAVDEKGRRVRANNAVNAYSVVDKRTNLKITTRTIHEPMHFLFVECFMRENAARPEIRTNIDHHNPGDPGYDKGPESFMTCSSIGQVITKLAFFNLISEDWGRYKDKMPPPVGQFLCIKGSWYVTVKGKTSPPGMPPTCEARKIPSDIVYCAAADHCLKDAYNGRCPGVDPKNLAGWRASVRASYQRRSIEEVLLDVERTTVLLMNAKSINIGGEQVKDLRPGAELGPGAPYDNVPCGEHGTGCEGNKSTCWSNLPELPEAAARAGVGFISKPMNQKGREGTMFNKYVIQCVGHDAVVAFKDFAKDVLECDEVYACPHRGFAGCYCTI